MLVLFDIDGTLVRAHGGGLETMAEVGASLFGRPFRVDSIDPSGRLDPHIYAEAAQASGVDDAAEHHAAFRERYVEALAAREAAGTIRVDALPGVSHILDRLRDDDTVTLGLLTGNYREAAHVKLRAAGIAPEWFVAAAFGDEAADRPGLVPVALTRHREIRGAALAASDVVIVGDTPRDVACGLAHGCTVIAVATGRHGADALREAGAHHVFDDFADPAPLLALIRELTQ